MKIYLLMTLLLLTACSNVPVLIKDPPAFDLSYEEALINANKYANAPVRWGGSIIEVQNEPSFSNVQVLLYPLGSYGRPDLDSESPGRFVIKSAEFLDPAVYKKDSSITVAGILNGLTEVKVGNKTLKLPLIQAKQLYIWPEQYYGNYYGGYGGYGGFGYGGFGGYYPYGGFYGYPYFGGSYYQPYYGGWPRR